MGDLKQMSYPDMLNRFRERRDESKVLLPIMSQAGQNVDPLKSVESCLSIGPGPGEYDLEFMKRSLPALKEIVAVEKDHYCAEELKKNIAKMYRDSLKHEVMEIEIEKYSTVKKFDSVLMFHLLYDFSTETRRRILKKALENWIDPERGFLIIINMSDDVDESNQKINVMQKIQHYFNGDACPMLVADVVKNDLKEIGGKLVWSQKYKCNMDFRIFDDDVAQIFNLTCDHVITNDAMKEALQKLVPSGVGTYVGELLVVSKL